MPISISEYVKTISLLYIGVYYKLIREDFSSTMFMLGMDIILVDCAINTYLHGGYFFIVFIIQSFLVRINKIRWFVDLYK